jgi:hypothetical protein
MVIEYIHKHRAKKSARFIKSNASSLISLDPFSKTRL